MAVEKSGGRSAQPVRLMESGRPGHQTMGPDVFCRYTALGSSQPGLGGVSCASELTKRTVLPASLSAVQVWAAHVLS
jgi:hypothetical protein